MRLIICSFAFMAFAFYELSGGADFDPVETRLARLEAPLEADVLVAEAQDSADVTPVSLNLETVSFEPVEDTPAAPLIESAPNDEILATLASLDEEPRIILPSLVLNTTPVIALPSTDEVLEEAAITETAITSVPVRSVTGNRVNVRGGPGTNFDVVTKLVRGDQVEVLQDPGEGWVMLRPVEGGPVGWIADFLLSEG